MNINLGINLNATKEEKEVIKDFLKELERSCNSKCDCDFCYLRPICDEFNLGGDFHMFINRLREAMGVMC